MGALERMRDEYGRARKRGDRVLMPEEVQSPMDRNPTLGVSAAMIADCAREVANQHLRSADAVMDESLRQIALGNDRRRTRRDSA